MSINYQKLKIVVWSVVLWSDVHSVEETSISLKFSKS